MSSMDGYEELIEFQEQLDERGVGTVPCLKCGEEHELEADGYTTCDCGTRVESPFLREGMI